MSSSIDAVFADLAADDPGDVLAFYDVEGQVLDLWDQLNELMLEEALLGARITTLSDHQPPTDEDVNAQLKIAEKECLEARAAYLLRQSIVEDVLIADPILKAVHSGPNATATERTLHPLVDRRDTLSIAHTNLAAALQSITRDSTAIKADKVRAIEQNRALTTTLLALADKVQAQTDTVIENPSYKARLEELQNDAATARKRWRIMKSVVAAVIAGSGVDWARDDALRELVLDDEDEAD